jgi:hypothetical protein
MTSKENLNENLHKTISGIFAKKSVGTHCNALIKALLSNFCVKIFNQNSLIPIQILNGFFIFYCATWGIYSFFLLSFC